jgi:hypothetical protein
MKTSYKCILALLSAAAVSACGDNAVQQITAVPPGAAVKFHNFGVNAPGVNFYAGTTKMTAISSTTGLESTNGTTYPAAGANGVGNAGFYSAIAPGTYTLTGNIAATTDNGLAISTLAGTTLANGKYYSYFQSGFYNTTAKTVEAFIVEDPFVAPTDFTAASVRFVNASSNSSPMTLYAKNTTTLVEVPLGAEIAYKSAGAFTSLPAGIYDLNSRTTGSSANAITRTAVTFLAGRVYTVSGLGDMTLPTTGSAATRPVFNVTANR